MPKGFVFLNTSNAPGLGPAEAKRMRAHVTRTNFATRRLRIARECQEEARRRKKQGDDDHDPSSDGREHCLSTTPPLPDPVVAVALLTLPTDTDVCIRYLLEEFRPLVFPSDIQAPYGLTDSSWIDMLVAEPALLNASMFMKLRFLCHEENASVSRRATVHICKAIGVINDRLSAPRTCFSDGMLAAVFMLGVGERLGNNRMGWDAHIEGLTQMIRLRLANGDGFIPKWFSDLMLYDSISESIMSTQTHHTKHINALRATNSQVMAGVSCITRRINQLHKMIDRYHTNTDTGPLAILLGAQIDAHTTQLHADLSALDGYDTTYVGVLAQSLSLFLHLSWPATTPCASLADQADALRTALMRPCARPCSSFHLKIWQFMVGAVAAQDGGGGKADTRRFFTLELERMFRALKIRRWADVVEVLERTFCLDRRLLGRFEGVWDEFGLEECWDGLTADASKVVDAQPEPRISNR